LVLKEIVETEDTYVNQLQLFKSEYCDELNKNSHGLDKEQVPILFANLAFIVTFHRKFLQKIQTSELSWSDSSCFGKIMIDIVPSLKLYYHYVNNYGKALRVFKAGYKIKEFRKFVDNLDYSPKLNGLCFESLQILPVQRIPRYVLLIETMLNNTPSDHSDKVLLKQCLDQLKELADDLNKEKMKSDNYEKYREILDKLDNYPDDFLKNDQRVFIKAGSMYVNKDKMKFFLFDDTLLLTKSHGNKYNVKECIPLSTASVLKEGNNFVLLSPLISDKLHISSNSDSEFKLLRKYLEQANSSLISTAFQDNTDFCDSNESSFLKQTIANESLARKKILARMIARMEEWRDSISILLEKYLYPINDVLKESTDEEAAQVMVDLNSNTPAILDLFSCFVDELTIRYNSWNENVSIADFFIEKKLELNCFYFYSNKYPLVMKAVSILHEVDGFPKFIRHLNKKSGHDFNNLLELPLKALPELLLFIQEFSQSSIHCKDYSSVGKVQKDLQELVAKIARRASTTKLSEMLGAY